MYVSFRYLEILNAVVVSGSISKAKRRLGLSQPSISQQLAKFEEELGTQLIYRRRGQNVELTPAGDHWFSASCDLLNQREKYEAAHTQNFQGNQIILRFGATPSLYTRFTEAAATIAANISQVTRFEHVFALDSESIVEMIDSHEINCAIVSSTSIQSSITALSVRHLFNDPIVWAVPKSVPPEQVADALSNPMQRISTGHPLNRHVEHSVSVPWSSNTSAWYHSNLPRSVPFFHASTHQVAVDIVAAGLATCHCPTSLLSHLSEQSFNSLRFYSLEIIGRDAVLIMPRHLATLKPFFDFQNQLATYIEHSVDTFSSMHHLEKLPPQNNLMSEMTVKSVHQRDDAIISDSSRRHFAGE